MRKKNGLTIIEVLISICIIAIVLALLFNILVQVRNEDMSNNIQSTFLITQATFVKEIEEDIINYGVKSVSSCSLSEANITNNLLNTGYESDFKCVKIEYAADYTDDNIGFLMIYNTFSEYETVNGKYQGIEDSARWMIQYVRGSYSETISTSSTPKYSSWSNLTQNMKELPDEINLTNPPYIIYTAAGGSSINAASLVIPIENSDAEHYDIELSFTFIGNDNFTCRSTNKTLLECNCTSSSALCQKTYS